MNVIQRMVAKKDESGFTLVEMLVVIFIMGILAAIVVFAVNGIGDRGQKSACLTDKHTLTVAEEANFAKFSSYTAEGSLVTNGLLAAQSSLYDITVPAGGASYTVAPTAGGACVAYP